MQHKLNTFFQIPGLLEINVKEIDGKIEVNKENTNPY